MGFARLAFTSSASSLSGPIASSASLAFHFAPRTATRRFLSTSPFLSSRHYLSYPCPLRTSNRLFIPFSSRLPTLHATIVALGARSLSSSVVRDVPAIDAAPSSSGVVSAFTSRDLVHDEVASRPSSAYIHVPFCRRRCFYCDFPIVAVGERTESKSSHMDARMTNYVELVCREIRLAADVTLSSPLKTVFFGGGTPSLLPPFLLLRILTTLKTHFGVDQGAEISIEMDPGTFDGQHLRQLVEGGVTRVSMGVQSFQGELLKSCGRAHGLREVYEAIDAIHESGLNNWSLDLISSLPNQTAENWEHSLREAVLASPSHISVYDLQIEEGTLFNKWYKAGQSPLPSDEISAEFYRTASARLQAAGYQHYEISNYAKEGHQCRHNLVYWKNEPYFAFGLGSTSYVDGKRFSRPRNFKEYEEFVMKFESSGGQVECPKDSVEERALDTVMLSLRLTQGLDIRQFTSKFGATVTKMVYTALLPFARSGHVIFRNAGMQPLSFEEAQNAYVEEGLGYVCLTDPEGFLLSNEVIASIFSPLLSGGNYHTFQLQL